MQSNSTVSALGGDITQPWQVLLCLPLATQPQARAERGETVVWVEWDVGEAELGGICSLCGGSLAAIRWGEL